MVTFLHRKGPRLQPPDGFVLLPSLPLSPESPSPFALAVGGRDTHTHTQRERETEGEITGAGVIRGVQVVTKADNLGGKLDPSSA